MTEPGGLGEPRIGDSEREQTIRALGDHFSCGRIDMHEYEERVTRAMQARTPSDLTVLFADLPGPHPLLASPVTGPAGAIPPYPAQTYRPVYGPVGYSDKSKLAAGLLQILLPFGVGRLYTGHTAIGIIQLLLFWLGMLPCFAGTGIAMIWCLIDGIVILAGNSTDAQGRLLRS